MLRRHLLKSVAFIAIVNFQSTHSYAGIAARLGSTSGPIEVTCKSLKMVFGEGAILPNRYVFMGRELTGSDSANVRAIVCRLAPRSYETGTIRVTKRSRSEFSLTNECEAYFGTELAAHFSLVYDLAPTAFSLSLRDVREAPGFELIEIALPDIVALNETTPHAWMAEGRDGGSFVRLSEARAFDFDWDGNFGQISIQLPVAMLGEKAIGCVMEVPAYMDGTTTRIEGAIGTRRAAIGTIQVYRVHGGRCYDMNDGADADCGTSDTPNLFVGQTPNCRVDFFECRGMVEPWLAGARMLRDRQPAIPSSYFSDKLSYLIAGKNKTEDKPRTTFKQSSDLISQVAKLTDNAPQLIYISGWVYDGQDTGYPSEDVVNSSLGGYDDLIALMDAGKTLNANVTLNVNYDDAYKSSPIFDEAFVARRPDGAIWASRAWDGEMSYIVGMAKFMSGGWGERRLDYTLSRYPIRDTLLVDALSWYAIRNDWDRHKPASGYKNLIDGKFKLLDIASRAGISIASEQLRYPFIGRMALAMNGPTFSPCPFGGQPIPLSGMVYRHSAIWGHSGQGSFDPGPNLFWNNRPSLWFQANSDVLDIVELYFLVTLPFTKLHNLAVKDYVRLAAGRRLVLEDESIIDLSGDGERYKAVFRGNVIAQDGTTTCPIDSHRIAFFSRKGGDLRYPLPVDWVASDLVAIHLANAAQEVVPIRIEAGQIVVTTSPREAVIVYRNGDGERFSSLH